MMYASAITPDYTLVPETPQLHAKPSVSCFIEQEVKRPSKQWITSIIAGEQEREQVVMRTEEFVLLPDTERVNRYWRIQTNVHHASGTTARPPKNTVACKSPPKLTLNWLSIVHDLSIRTLRDLRGKHVPMLKRMLDACMASIEEQTGIPRDQVMAYVHYPPSVYQLHVHFSYPYGQYCHRDAYRVHSLGAIINNLEIDSEYYSKATLYLAMYKQSPHYQALTASDEPDHSQKNNHV
jgi:m7GpppX diphosphatase